MQKNELLFLKMIFKVIITDTITTTANQPLKNSYQKVSDRKMLLQLC